LKITSSYKVLQSLRAVKYYILVAPTLKRL